MSEVCQITVCMMEKQNDVKSSCDHRCSLKQITAVFHYIDTEMRSCYMLIINIKHLIVDDVIVMAVMLHR